MQKQNEIQIFENKEFGEIRVIEIDGQPWWILKDVCSAIGIGNVTDTANRLDADEKAEFDSIEVSSNGTKQSRKRVIISESGLYAVILRSDKPSARSFRKWITSEVLPSIRRHGAYVTDNALDQLIDNPETAMKFFSTLKDELEKNVEALTPKADYYDIVLQCPGAILPTVIAKDYGYSATKFNKLLHALRVQYKRGDNVWVLYQEHADKGYTVTKTHNLHRKDGEQFTVIWMYFTQRGRFWLYELLKEQGILPIAERGNLLESQ